MMNVRAGILFTLLFSVAAAAQESEETTVVTETTRTGYDLVSPLYLEDADPVPQGQLDLRFRFEWSTDDDQDVDGDDDFVLGQGLYWGFAPNWELSLAVPFNVGDGDNKSDGVRGFDGNGDATVGISWRFYEQSGYVPAMALQAKVRHKTGYRSSGCDGEARLVLTNEYDSGIRSHVNIGVETEDSVWHRLPVFVVIGMDGPLCADGAVRWIVDYFHINAEYLNGSNSNVLELGYEWQMSERHKWGLTGQFGLDDHEETPDFGARLVYSLALF